MLGHWTHCFGGENRPWRRTKPALVMGVHWASTSLSEIYVHRGQPGGGLWLVGFRLWSELVCMNISDEECSFTCTSVYEFIQCSWVKWMTLKVQGVVWASIYLRSNLKRVDQVCQIVHKVMYEIMKISWWKGRGDLM